VKAERIRVRGLVQGVGFRPTVWRLAQECGLIGDVRNDGEGVLIRVRAETAQIERFCALLREHCPPLARIDALERSPLLEALNASGFDIRASDAGAVSTGIVPDAATCGDCRQEIFDPGNRRYRYPFTNCTHCGPRLSIVQAIPYDRANTSMSVFAMCPECAAEYRDPSDRRFHAQPNACPRCGPQVWLEDAAGRRIDPAAQGDADAIHCASRLLAQGHILAIKGIGGFHLACDAGDSEAVARLRARKRRFHKPFALMARDARVIQRYCSVSPAERELLQSPAAPIVLLERDGPLALPAQLAPGQRSLGFMLPYSPLHLLLLADWERPLVMTSGNLSEEPPCIDNQDAGQRLRALADYYLLHERAIVNRVDDSVLRVMGGQARFLRRARGYAPAPIQLPDGFRQAPPLLALGGELKSAFCLLKDGQAVLSQHLGDLEEARTAEAFESTLELYRELFAQQPDWLVADLHPDYRSTRLGRAWAKREQIELLQTQHHFAHIASVLADNGWPLDAPAVLGVALDGLGYGADGTLWGGEFLRADYRDYQRLAHLPPTPMPGGMQAILQPWRNTYAQLATHIGWRRFAQAHADLEITHYLQQKPLAMLHGMLEKGLNSPLSSSCGRLFDAVAGALGLQRDEVSYEGQAAIELEALAATAAHDGADGYPFGLIDALSDKPLALDPAPMWQALLHDLEHAIPAASIAARFHRGLAKAVADLALRLCREQDLQHVALSGGVLQNKLLFEDLQQQLERAGVTVLSQRQVPANDGGLALGQAAIAAARLIEASAKASGQAFKPR
jgi:hydrogenase maturation protein HypF